MRNKLLILLTTLMLSCASVGLLTACGHTHNHQKVVTDPTCEAGGFTTYTCECGDSYVADEVPALGHSYGAFVSNGDDTHTKTCANDATHKITENCNGGSATCIAKATCSDCNAQYGATLGHAWGDWVSVGDGTHKRICGNDPSHVEIVECGGGTATCEEKPVCSTCHGEYGEARNHAYPAEWTSVGDGNHKKVCANDPSHVLTEECDGGTRTCEGKPVCSTCHGQYGESLGGHAYPDVWSPVGNGTHQKVCGNDANHVLTEDCDNKNEIIDDKYLKAASTPTTKAQYYYSCECGGHGEEFFEYGEVAEVIDYDASTGKFITNALNGKVIEKVIVGEEELTVDNGGIIVNEGVYTFRAKTSADDAEPGITFASLETIGQYISVKFVTADETIEFRFVSVWSTIIDDADEFLQTLDNNVFGDGATKDVSIEKNIKLANDIDMAGKVFDNTLGTVFKGYFEGAGNVVSNIAVTGYNINGGNGGIFGSIKGYIRNVAFLNLMGAGKKGLYSGPLGSTIEYDCFKASANVENVYIKASEDLLTYFNVAGIGRIHTQAQVVNFVVELPTEKPVIDEAWMNQGTDWTGKGSLFASSSTLITNGPHGKNNIYVISKTPLLYFKSAGKTPNVNSLGEYTDYFMYGENETDVHFNFKYFETQLDAGVEPTVQNTQVYVEKADGSFVKTNVEANSKTHIVNGIRRYDDYAAFANDNSEKHLANLEKMAATGMWTIVNNAPVFTSVYNRHYKALFPAQLTVDGEVASEINATIGDEFVVDFTTQDAQAQLVSITSNNDNLVVDGKKVTAQKEGASVITLTYKANGKEYTLTLNVKVSLPATIVDDVIIYNASTGELLTKALNGKSIVKAVVNGEELTIENGGIIYKDSAYTFRAKTSLEDTQAGIPYIAQTTSNNIAIDIVTADEVISLTNVEYYSIIIDTADGFLKALDVDVRASKLGAEEYLTVEDCMLLANDLDMTGYTFMATLGKGMLFKGYFEGNGNVVSNLTVKGYAGNSRSGGVFGTPYGFVKNVAFINLMGTGKRGLQSAPLGNGFPWDGLTTDNNVENVYVQTSADILKYFSAAGMAKFDYRAKVVNFVVDTPVQEVVIDEAWMNEIDEYSGKGLITLQQSLFQYKTNNFNNVYFISKNPIMYKHAGGAVNINSLGEKADYFVYGENETDVHFNFKYFETQLAAGVKPTVQNTIVYQADGKTPVFDEKASKTFVLNNFRRYDDYASFAGDKDEKHLQNLDEMKATGMWTIVNGAPIFKGVYNRHYDSFVTVELEVNGINDGKLEIGSEATVGVKSFDNTIKVVSVEASNNNVAVQENKIIGQKAGEVTITVTYELNGKQKTVTTTFNVVKPIIEVADAIDYDANSGTLSTKIIGSETIVKAVVNGEELTIENGGIVVKDGVYTFRAKTSATDELAGVPFISNRKTTPSQQLELSIETEDLLYVFENVNYWTIIVNDADEFVETFTHDYGKIDGTTNIYVEDLIKIGNDIDLLVEEEGAEVYKQNAVAFTGAGNANHYLSGSQNGFAGIVEGAGNVINNFKPSTYGLVGYIGNYGSNHIEKSAIRNLAFTNVLAESGKAIFANGMYWNCTVPFALENVYVQVTSKSIMTEGLINLPSSQLVMNNVFVDYAKDKVVAPTGMKFDKDYSAADGKTYIAYNNVQWNSATCDAGTLFSSLRRADKFNANVTNVYVASAYPIAWQSYNSGAYKNGFFKVDTATNTLILQNNGYAGGAKSNIEYYYGYASNETVGTIPVIKEMKQSFASVVNTAEYVNNAMKGNGFFCNKCEEFTVVGAKGDACAITDGCDGTLASADSSGSAFGNVRSYIWTFHDLGTGYTNKAISETNGVWKFDGVTKYDNVADMKSAGNSYASFIGAAGNGCWTVVDGMLTWAKLAQPV